MNSDKNLISIKNRRWVIDLTVINNQTNYKLSWRDLGLICIEEHKVKELEWRK